jgi:hypothetical protein
VLRGGAYLKIGASFGISGLAVADTDWTRVLQRADAACYNAKKDGRNMIRVAGLPPKCTRAQDCEGCEAMGTEGRCPRKSLTPELRPA